MAFFDLPLNELKTYLPPREEPADFDSFWKSTLDEARVFPLNAKFERVDYGLVAQETFDVTYSGFGGQPIKGWLILPVEVHRDAPLPCVVEFIGYGGGRQFGFDWLLWASAGYAHFVMDTRGQGSTWSAGDTPDLWKTAGAALLLALATLLVCRERRRRPYLLVGWLWYLGTLVPVSGLVQGGGQSMADRYTYLPLVGVFVMASWGAAEALCPLGKRWLATLAALVLVPLLVLTQRQALLWRSSSALYENALRVTGNNALVVFFVARTLDLEGRDDDAIAWYRRVVRASPDYAEARKRLGAVLSRANRPRDAVPQLREALRLEPRDVEVMTLLASALVRIGEIDPALHLYRQASPPSCNSC